MSQPGPRWVTPVVAVLAAAGLALAVLRLVAVPPGQDAVLAGAVGAVALAASARWPLRLPRTGHTHAFTFDEAVVVALVGAGYGAVAPAAALVGQVAGNGGRRLPAVKVAFNAGLLAVAADLAVRAWAVVGADPVGLAGAGRLAAVATVAWATTLLGVSTLLARLGGGRVRDEVRDGWPWSGASLLANLAVGVPLARLAHDGLVAAGAALPLVVLAVLGQRAGARSRELHDAGVKVAALSRQLHAASTTSDTAALLRTTAHVVQDVFRAGWVRVDVPDVGCAVEAADGQVLPADIATSAEPVLVDGELVAPVLAGDAVVGHIAAGNRRGVERWDEGDVSRLAAVADDLGSALHARDLVAALRSERDALRRTSDRLQRVVAVVDDGVALVDLGQVRTWNPALERLTGIPAADALGRPLLDVLEVADAPARLGGRPGTAAGLLAAAATPGPAVVADRGDGGDVVALVAADRSRRVVEVGVRTVVAGPGRFGAVVTVRDVTALRRQEAVQREFVTTVSHELRTPLTSMRGAADLLVGEDLDDATRGVLAGMVRRQVDRLERLAEDFGRYGDLIAGPDEPGRREPLDLRLVVGPLAAHARAEVDVELPVEPVDVVVDEVAIARAVAAVLDNVADHGGGRAALRVEVSRDAVVVAVTDDGPGVPPAERRRVMEPFVRLGETGTRRQGAGLGLAIARTTLQQHGGDLVLEGGSGGRGCVARLELPRAREVRPRRSPVRADAA